MEVITSLENKKIKNLSKLLLKKYRDVEEKFLVEGEHLVLEASKKGCLLEVLQTEDYVGNYHVPVTYVTYDVIKKLSHSVTPQKVIGVVQKIQEREIGHKVLLLDHLQDPGNLGTIIRSSVAFQVDTIVLSSDCVDLYNDKVIRASEGMLFSINIIKRDLSSFIDELHRKEYFILGTKVTDGEDIRNIELPSKVALVMGSEGSGVREEILQKCDKYVYISMNSQCESLNVGVATSILLYEMM